MNSKIISCFKKKYTHSYWSFSILGSEYSGNDELNTESMFNHKNSTNDKEKNSSYYSSLPLQNEAQDETLTQAAQPPCSGKFFIWMKKIKEYIQMFDFFIKIVLD